MYMRYLSLLISLSSIFLSGLGMAGTLTVEVKNIEKQGEIHLAIYDDANVFENDNGDKGGAAQGIINGVIEEVKTGTASYQFDIPDGTYAIGIFIDTNYNNKMDRNFLGIPKEQYGFSNNAKGSFGPPSFKDASFDMRGDTNLSIDL